MAHTTLLEISFRDSITDLDETTPKGALMSQRMTKSLISLHLVQDQMRLCCLAIYILPNIFFKCSIQQMYTCTSTLRIGI